MEPTISSIRARSRTAMSSSLIRPATDGSLCAAQTAGRNHRKWSPEAKNVVAEKAANGRRDGLLNLLLETCVNPRSIRTSHTLQRLSLIHDPHW